MAANTLSTPHWLTMKCLRRKMVIMIDNRLPTEPNDVEFSSLSLVVGRIDFKNTMSPEDRDSDSSLG
jgi:hypothetical protein